MTTIAEQIRKEDEAFKKAKASHRARLKKLEDTTYKRIFKQLKKTDFLEIEFTDIELVDGFNKMIEWKRKRNTQDHLAAPGSDLSQSHD